MCWEHQLAKTLILWACVIDIPKKFLFDEFQTQIPRFPDFHSWDFQTNQARMNLDFDVWRLSTLTLTCGDYPLLYMINDCNFEGIEILKYLFSQNFKSPAVPYLYVLFCKCELRGNICIITIRMQVKGQGKLLGYVSSGIFHALGHGGGDFVIQYQTSRSGTKRQNPEVSNLSWFPLPKSVAVCRKVATFHYLHALPSSACIAFRSRKAMHEDDGVEASPPSSPTAASGSQRCGARGKRRGPGAAARHSQYARVQGRAVAEGFKARRRRAPTGSDQSHEFGANRGVLEWHSPTDSLMTLPYR